MTQGAVIPDFLIQYEESDWTFLARLASHFGTFLIPDCCAAHGRAYFGLPDLGEETVLYGEEYQQIKDITSSTASEMLIGAASTGEHPLGADCAQEPAAGTGRAL